MVSQKILIVDDSKTIRMQIREMLPKGGVEVLEANDGVEGLERISQMHPNLVLLDFFMPRMNGWEVIQKIQNNPVLKSIPVVMMSGRREDVEQTVPELFDYFEFLSKPFEQPVLMQAVKAAMAKAKSRQQPAAKPAASVQAAQPTAAGATSTATGEMQMLKAELQQLRQENAQLKAEFEAMKKQMNQIVTFIRQKLK